MTAATPSTERPSRSFSRDDPAAIATARDLTRRIFEGEKVDPELHSAALHVSAAHGDQPLLRALIGRIGTDLTPAERRETLQALGGFREAALVDPALAFALSEQVKSTEIALIPFELSRAEENRASVVEWVIRNHDLLAKRVPELHFARLLRVADGNSPALVKRFSEFLLDPVRVSPAAIKQAGLVTERVMLRAALQAREQAAVDRALPSLGRTFHDSGR
jgi:hypothetical protein